MSYQEQMREEWKKISSDVLKGQHPLQDNDDIADWWLSASTQHINTIFQELEDCLRINISEAEDSANNAVSDQHAPYHQQVERLYRIRQFLSKVKEKNI